jgi:hypothetical protein
MLVTIKLSRRQFVRMSSLAALGAGFAGCLGRANAQPPGQSPLLPTVGNIRVKNVRIDQHIGVVGVAPYMQNRCGLQLGGGIHIKAEVDLEAVSGTKPAYFGALAFVQNVDFHHRRTPPGQAAGNPNFHFACADSHVSPQSPWELDGHYPYNNHRINCAGGLNTIELSDAPGVFLEVPPAEFERVFVQPGDRFRTYLIWEATDNNQPATATNPAKRNVLARVDWVWKGSATNIASPQAQCPSQLQPPNGWNVDPGAEARVERVLIGKAAVTPTPPARIGTPNFASPVANPNIWVRCR